MALDFMHIKWPNVFTAAWQRGMVGLWLLCYRGKKLLGRIIYFNRSTGMALQLDKRGQRRWVDGVRACLVPGVSVGQGVPSLWLN